VNGYVLVGDRSDDEEVDRFGSKTGDGGDLLQPGSFYVSFPRSRFKASWYREEVLHKPGEALNWFVLRYYSIVIITSLVTAATAAHLATKFDRFSQIGNIIGTSISATFLILLGIMNGWILYKLVRGLRAWVRGDMEVDAAKGDNGEELWEKRGGGPMFWILKKLFRLIDQ
jgi:hypothetical protein